MKLLLAVLVAATTLAPVAVQAAPKAKTETKAKAKPKAKGGKETAPAEDRAIELDDSRDPLAGI